MLLLLYCILTNTNATIKSKTVANTDTNAKTNANAKTKAKTIANIDTSANAKTNANLKCSIQATAHVSLCSSSTLRPPLTEAGGPGARGVSVPGPAVGAWSFLTGSALTQNPGTEAGTAWDSESSTSPAILKPAWKTVVRTLSSTVHA